MEWAFETCMSWCAISAQHFLHPCAAVHRVLLQKWLTCCFSHLVMQLLWVPGHCSKARSPTQHRDTGPPVLRGPRGAPGGLVSSCLDFVTELPPVPLQWRLWSKGTFSNLVASAQKFPAPRNLKSFLSPSLKETGWIFLSSLPTPITRLLCYSFIHYCDFSMGFFFSWWHLSWK